MRIEKLKVEQLIPADYNPRKDLKPGDPAYEKLRRSMEEFGYVEPIVWNEKTGNIVGGHQRFKILQGSGVTEVECVVVSLDPEKEKALNIALNKIVGDWDEDALRDVLASMDEASQLLTGFDMAEINALLHAPDEIIEDDFDVDGALGEIQEPITKRGDVWTLGRHRLMCGDSTSADDIKTLMNGSKAAMCFTDPPWNVAIGTDRNPRHRQREGLKNDNLKPDDFRNFLGGFITALTPHLSGDLYCVLGASEWPLLDSVLRECGYHWSATIIWKKDSFVLGRGNYHRRYEPIWYGWHKSISSSFNGRRDLDDVWEIQRPKASPEHPTMKPVEIYVRAISNSSRPRDFIVDPFGGSGTAAIACEQTDRRALIMELDEKYCDVIVKRWETFAGEKAIKG